MSRKLGAEPPFNDSIFWPRMRALFSLRLDPGLRAEPLGGFKGSPLKKLKNIFASVCLHTLQLD